MGTNGVAKGSTARTICNYTLADSVKIVVQAWCPVSSVNKIAFLGITPTEVGVYTVSATGGTPTRIYSVNQTTSLLNPGPLECGSLTWSNDGTKLAFVEQSPLSTPDTERIYMIRVINTSGVLQTTLDSGNHCLGGLKWSHSGMDSIACYRTNVLHNSVSSDFDLYVIGVTAGSTPRFVKSSAICAFWSPNNSELLYSNYTNASPGIAKINVRSGATTSLSSISYGSVGNYGDWKQP